MDEESSPNRITEDGTPPLLDKKEAAEWLSVCTRTIDHWLLEGWMPVIQLSPRIQRFNPRHILAAIEELYGKGHGYPQRQPRKQLDIG